MKKKATMTRNEMLDFIKKNPNVKITHESFAKDEYLYSLKGIVYDENGYLFEDFVSEFHNGLRMRIGDLWETGWSIYEEDSEETTMISNFTFNDMKIKVDDVIAVVFGTTIFEAKVLNLKRWKDYSGNLQYDLTLSYLCSPSQKFTLSTTDQHLKYKIFKTVEEAEKMLECPYKEGDSFFIIDGEDIRKVNFISIRKNVVKNAYYPFILTLEKDGETYEEIYAVFYDKAFPTREDAEAELKRRNDGYKTNIILNRINEAHKAYIDAQRTMMAVTYICRNMIDNDYAEELFSYLSEKVKDERYNEDHVRAAIYEIVKEHSN